MFSSLEVPRGYQELALSWDADVCTWTIQGDAEQYKLSKERQEIRRVVEMADEPVTPTYVADALGKSYNAVKKTMWEMSRDGQLSSTGNGRYTPVTGNPGHPGNPHKPGVSNPVTEVTEVTDPAGDTSPISEGGSVSGDSEIRVNERGEVEFLSVGDVLYAISEAGLTLTASKTGDTLKGLPSREHHA